MLAFLCDRRGGFRRLLRSPALRKAALCLVLCTAAVQGARAADTLPQTLPREVAAEYTFFLAVPVMFGASLLKIVKFGAISGTELGVLDLRPSRCFPAGCSITTTGNANR